MTEGRANIRLSEELYFTCSEKSQVQRFRDRTVPGMSEEEQGEGRQAGLE